MNQQFVHESLCRARNVIEEQNKEIADLKRDNAIMSTAASVLHRYVTAVSSHNQSCDAECNDGVACGYEGYLRRTGRRCASCPAMFKVDVMPHKGSA